MNTWESHDIDIIYEEHEILEIEKLRQKYIKNGFKVTFEAIPDINDPDDIQYNIVFSKRKTPSDHLRNFE